MRPLRMTAWLTGVLLVCLTHSSHAFNCSATVQDFDFGSVNVLSATNPLSQVSASITFTCTRTLLEELLAAEVAVCLVVGDGTGGRQPGGRTLAKGSDLLLYELYRNAARTIVLGSPEGIGQGTGFYFSPQHFNGGTASATTSAYGTLFGNQSSAAVGDYVSDFSTLTQAQVRWITNQAICPTNTQAEGATAPSFAARATVEPFCLLDKPQDLNFGTHADLSVARDSTTDIALTCTRDANYSVELTNGLHFSGGRRLRHSDVAEYVSYELYRDAGYTEVWGEGALAQPGIGTGTLQSLTVFGRTPVQVAPRVGVFQDTVTVTVTF